MYILTLLILWVWTWCKRIVRIFQVRNWQIQRMRNSDDNKWINVWALKSDKPSLNISLPPPHPGLLAARPYLLQLLSCYLYHCLHALPVPLCKFKSYILSKAQIHSHFFQKSFSVHPAYRALLFWNIKILVVCSLKAGS